MGETIVQCFGILLKCLQLIPHSARFRIEQPDGNDVGTCPAAGAAEIYDFADYSFAFGYSG